MASKIIVHDSEGNDEEFLCERVMTIGRDPASTIQLKDPLVSRNHGILRLVGDSDYYLLDSGSRNGVFLNETRISSPVLLTDGDQICIGESALSFHQETTQEFQVESDRNVFAETLLNSKPDIRSIIVLVSDIRGFTTMSEAIPIGVLTRLMADWFEKVQSIVELRSGRIDKFIGDCVLAKWEVVGGGSTHANLQALHCALEIEEYTSGLHLSFPEIQSPLQIGVGLNKGEAAVGVSSYNTIMGDVVNIAFRLESVSKEIGSDLVMNSSFYQMLDKLFPVDRQQRVSVKGKLKDLTVLGMKFSEVRHCLENFRSADTRNIFEST